MLRYVFHFHDGTDQPDHCGTEFASAQAARDAAVVFMGEKLKELDGDFWPEGEWSIRVVDETGEDVCAIRVTGTSPVLPVDHQPAQNAVPLTHLAAFPAPEAPE